MRAALRRVIVKVSGEALSGGGDRAVSWEAARWLAGEIRAAAEMGSEVGVVVGGGNIIRGAQTAPSGDERVTADYMGMIATIVNALALRGALEELGQKATVMSALPCGRAAELYDHRQADRYLRAGRVVIFAAGTGNPFFSTDTAAALRAIELGADALLKATKIDGVYDKDPLKASDAKRYDELTYIEAIEKRLGVMDLTAMTLAREHELPIVVFALSVAGNIARAVSGDAIGTTVKGG
jgi:uridylate kinase